MPVKGAFTVRLSGPLEARDQLVQTLTEAGIAARATKPDFSGEDEAAHGWIRADFHEGTEKPSVEFQRASRERVESLGEPVGYTVRSYGVAISGGAQKVIVVHKATGQVVAKGFDLTPDRLPALARALGFPAEDLEIREPPGQWDIPRQ